MSPDEIKSILDQHANWHADYTTGKRAHLTGANLYGANLTGANLIGANLIGAYLTGAYLTGADLTGASIAHGWQLVRA
jgi:uncharacterized protein YjbI with pentapeptide repeats